jgi:hypothetical protein
LIRFFDETKSLIPLPRISSWAIESLWSSIFFPARRRVESIGVDAELWMFFNKTMSFSAVMLAEGGIKFGGELAVDDLFGIESASTG